MSGSYCGIRLYFYVLVVGAALLFLAIQVMAMGNPSPGLKLEDCDWPGQSGQNAMATATRTLDGPRGDTSIHDGLGGGGTPRDQTIIDDDEKLREVFLASGECPPRNPS